jgi:uncharacterized protein YdhG (YjbR/CyaY superfamily)
MLIFFAGFKDHIGVYPVPAGTKDFQKRLAPYRAQKSSVHFALDRPIPLGLVAEMVKHRIKEQRGKKAR